MSASAPRELLTTGEVAALLGVSRQHVVDLCDRGSLPCTRVGTHRRIRRQDVDEFLGGALRREAERSLWLHRAVAGRLVADPEAGMERARANVRRMLSVHPSGMSASWLAEWSKVLDGGVDAVLEVLSSRAPRAVELRQNTPFAGVLGEEERQAVLAAFRRHWRVDHSAA